MRNTASKHPDLTVISPHLNESLYVGVDIGKQQHFAGFVSNMLLARHGHFEACPAFKDERTRSRKGKLKVIGRIAGQITEMIYALLTKDAATLSKIPPGVEPPEPMLYDVAIHQAHKKGHYRPLKPAEQPVMIVLVPKQ